MLILLNKYCSGGKGFEKWRCIQNYFVKFNAAILNTDDSELSSKLSEAIWNGETVFIAAGGDGTVNHLLNLIIETAGEQLLKKFLIGAAGIGSSNDFHKPFKVKMGKIPISIDFENADLRDVGVLSYEFNGKQITKYFLINASIGITAEANNLFNKTDSILHLLKKINTKSAILYSALKTISGYKNLNAELRVNDTELKTKITNLGVTKNPHFSGDFCYDSIADFDNGKFNVHLAYDMQRMDVLKLMRSLTNQGFSKTPKTKSWQSNRISVSSINEFAVEYDGEVITTNKVEFNILPKFIRVCGNGKIT
ncbi:MAG: hypothetical protein HXY50_07195 [Ignavibacteriaceae bacterium]|nr:hypothetical protein [Ignavibacteriaceae bacterium]